MNKRFQASLAALLFALAAIFLAGASASRAVTATSAASGALSSLPASDFIIFVDTQRLISDTLPNFLAGDPSLLAKFNAKLERFQNDSGVDPRSFDNLAVGFRFSPSGSRRGDMRVVAIARGRFVASDLIEAGFAKARAKENVSREEQVYEGKKIFVLLSQHDREEAAAAGNGSNAQAEKSDSNRMAVAEFDSNTIVMGDLESVRAALNQSVARVDQSLVDLATRNANAVAGFAGNLPSDVARTFGLGNERANKLAASIRQVYGSASTVGTEAQATIAARTETAEQAHDIAQAINGLKLISKFGITRGVNKAEVEAFSNLLNNLKINAQDNEIEIKINVTQAEVAPLMRNF